MGCQHPGKLRTLCLFPIKVRKIGIELFFIQIQSGNKRKFKTSTIATESTWKVHAQTLIIDCGLWRKQIGCFLLIWQFCVFQMQRWGFSSYCNICTMSRTSRIKVSQYPVQRVCTSVCLKRTAMMLKLLLWQCSDSREYLPLVHFINKQRKWHWV